MKNQFHLVATFLVCLLFASFGYSQVSPELIKQKKAELLKQRESMTREQINEIYAQQNITRRPVMPKVSKELLSTESTIAKPMNKSARALTSIPEDAIFPIESDEVQAILMTWMYDTRTVNGNQTASQTFEGKGTEGYYSYNLVDVYSVPDVATNSDYAKLFAELANGIQKHTQVWINVWSAEDSTTIKEFMEQRGTPLTNYRFFVHPGNQFWFRDFGPMAFYYGDNDDLAFLDLEYYPGRPLDDALPILIAEDLDIPVYYSTIEYEGGNILLDGLGTLVTTSALYGNNEDEYGQAFLSPNSYYGWNYSSKTPLTQSQVDDSLRNILNLSNLIVFPKLDYDGGTGHIDLYCDMWEETGFVVSQYPESMSNFSDAQKVASNLDSLKNTIDYFGNKYFASRIPLPAKNNGTFYSSDQEYNDSYTRAFSNHTFVNDGIIQPVFYDSTATTADKKGDVAGNLAALEIMKQAYPGYTFEEVDVRKFDAYGGAIHCITKQIPAENPVRIYHQPIRYINMSETPMQNATLNILSQNKSGIAGVKVFYRHSNETNFSEAECVSLGDNMYSVDIPLQENATKDTIYYYISSTSNNGKTITKPMTAPEGYYTLVYGTEITGVVQEDVYGNGSTTWLGLQENSQSLLNGISEVYPNPAQNEIKVTLPQLKQDLYYRVMNLKGQVVMQNKIGKNETELQMNVSSLKSGNYWIYFTDGNLSAVRKLVIAK
ncbi:MAG: agmatine deiminase family protein [Bacteroidales bacterium]|nr:agmatine deiminase family protein [Bacteroidales bacterium]